ncbi:hypothetical protein EN742_06465 [Mesorhizobium sp. M4A.F.Ca.ET.020.02.1.1]|uniref:hypothetical protein n=1 Tax=Mesorhizobium sp. M4A.F.Ca.ET.020.02.1.1 TaxID=2496652 RepID=UPI000FD1F2A1|nr:hypothetical protein [Mesorhizobium sp. M4A.F.Ca.ET.020.02.1.1]RVD42855.1 hypothetical protein EN742_06465 [Mesorhizobium sp. M4A.F.Ca.ET.020.02.1.1]
MSTAEKANDNIDAFVSVGTGDLVTVMMMPDSRAWRFTDISPDKARHFAERLLSAANQAEVNASTVPRRAPR